MTILEAIHRVDALRHNTFTQEEKIGWSKAYRVIPPRESGMP